MSMSTLNRPPKKSHGSVIAGEMDSDLDGLAQLILFKLYTQICLCFPLASSPSEDSSITQTLTNGLERLVLSYPWLAGQVVRDDRDIGTFKFKPFEKTPRLLVKDLRHDPTAPNMTDLRRANFPSSMLDESIVAPCPTLPGSSSTESESDPAPVLLLQATFIIGGLLLTIVGSHNAMDMVGQGQIMHLFSKACRNEPFTSDELSSGNLPRRNLIPLFDEAYEPGPELAHQIPKPSPPPPTTNDANAHTAPLPAPTYARATFIFPATSLAALKALATQTIIAPASYISTDDALSALIWQAVTRARLPRLNPTSKPTKFGRAVDVRKHLGIPPTYPGLMQNMAFSTSTPQQLLTEPLGGIASRLRVAVDRDSSNLAHKTRALATLLDRAPDESVFSFTGETDPSVDLMLSSWAKVDCYNLDFNLGLGKPEAVRRPQFAPVESLIYLMPRAPDGEIAVAICLRDEDMEKLREDEQFAMYGKYIG